MKSFKIMSAFLAIVLIASVSYAGPVGIANGDLDDVPYGFSQGIPANWSTTGASWFGNPGGAHTGSNAWYAAGNGFPGPSGGNLFQDVTAAVSAAFGGLTTSSVYTLTSSVYIKGNTGISFGIRQLASSGPSGTSIDSLTPANDGLWNLMTNTQTFTYMGGAIFLNASWSGNIGTNLDTFSLSTGSGGGGAPVPEPSSFAMLGLGLLGLGFLGYRKVRK